MNLFTKKLLFVVSVLYLILYSVGCWLVIALNHASFVGQENVAKAPYIIFLLAYNALCFSAVCCYFFFKHRFITFWKITFCFFLLVECIFFTARFEKFFSGDVEVLPYTTDITSTFLFFILRGIPIIMMYFLGFSQQGASQIKERQNQKSN